MDENGKIIIVGFIAILIGVIFAGAIADSIYENTEIPYNTIVNETWTLNSSGETSTFWVTDANYTLEGDDVVASTITLRSPNATLTLDADYRVDSTNDDAVRLDILDTVITQQIASNDSIFGLHTNETFVGYNKFQDNYIRGSGVSRLLMKLINIFFAIGILSIGVWMVWKGFKGYLT